MAIIPKWLADFWLGINRLYYRQLFKSVYGGEKRSPSWFDHRIDLYYHWPDNLFWLERSISPRECMFEGCKVLDLFCDDGFYSRYFYSTIATHIDAVDKDPSAIAHANRYHSHPKGNYLVLDATEEEFPHHTYDVIVWFEAIEHLDVSEYGRVAQRMKNAIGETGVVMGSTPIVPRESMNGRHWEHQNEFSSVEQLSAFLNRDFHKTELRKTVYPVKGGGKQCTVYFTLKGPK